VPNSNPTKPPPAPPRRATPGIPGTPLPPNDSTLVRDAVRAVDVERSKRLAQEAFERRRPSPPGGTEAPTSVSPQVDQAIGKAVRALLGRLWPILLAGGLGSGGAVVAQRTAAPPERVEAHGTQLTELRTQVQELQDEVARLSARERAWQRWASDQQDWQLSLLERQGIRVRRPEGSPAPAPLDATVPLRAPGRVTAGPSLEVSTPPPAPP
jgi:hypothetical protein